MGGQSIPQQTMSVQAYNPNKIDKAKLKMEQEKQALQMAYYRPALEDMLAKRAMFKGVLGGDTGMMRQAVGLPNTASPEQVRAAILRRQGIPSTPVTGVTPKQMAAKGGIMQLRKYAAGGKATSLNSTQKQFVKDMAKLMDSGKELSQAQQDRLNKIEESTGVNVSPYSQVGTQTPGDPAIASAATRLQTGFTAKNPAQPPDSNSPNAPADVRPPTQENPITPIDALMPKTYGVSPGLDENANIDPTKPMTYTDPWVQNAMKEYNAMQAPTEWNQAGNMYRTAGAGLQSLANYTPQQVAYQNAVAQQASAQQASAERASAERASAERATASQMAAIANINADRINLGQYNVNASQMERPEDVAAREIQAQYIQGSRMERPEDVTAQQLQRYQMDPTAQVSTKDLEAYQMAGPGSWTDEGVSSKFMSPYMQGVVDISKREAERDYTKQMNALAAKAKSAGAFGGSRQALERSEAQRNFNQQLQDIQTKGLQSAYESGRSQYGQELSLSQQAALNNLQSKLSTQSQSSQQALQAMLSNQNIDYQTKVQNLAASLGVQSQEAQNMLNASLANQQAGLTTNQQNLQAEMQKQLANQQSSMTSQQANQDAFLRAALANQQSGLTVGQINAQLAQQAALANQGVGVQGDLANQETALRAYLANQQTQFGVGSLNANLANQVALQNAQLGTNVNMQNAQLGTQANLQNAQLGTQVSMNNAQLGTQAALQNAQLGTQVNLANSQYGLQAAMANQQAGLQGNQQNIGAYNTMGNMAQGLGSIGNSNANWTQQQFGNAKQLADWSMQQGQGYLDRNTQGNLNILNASNMPAGAPT